jgi:hypothetical protein
MNKTLYGALDHAFSEQWSGLFAAMATATVLPTTVTTAHLMYW